MLPRPPRTIQLVAQRAHADAEQLRRARTIVARRLRRPETEKSRQTPTTRLQPAAANGVLSSQRSGCRGSEDGWNRRVGIPIPLLYWTSAESRQNGSACHKKPGPNRSRPWEQSRARLALPLVVHRVMPAVGTTTADAPACLTTLAHAVAASAARAVRAVGGLVDRRRREGLRTGQFLVPGSSSLQLLRQSSESLAGRNSFVELTPLRVDELWSSSVGAGTSRRRPVRPRRDLSL